jgi:hypothetical protein
MVSLQNTSRKIPVKAKTGEVGLAFFNETFKWGLNTPTLAPTLSSYHLCKAIHRLIKQLEIQIPSTHFLL